MTNKNLDHFVGKWVIDITSCITQQSLTWCINVSCILCTNDLQLANCTCIRYLMIIWWFTVCPAIKSSTCFHAIEMAILSAILVRLQRDTMFRQGNYFIFKQQPISQPCIKHNEFTAAYAHIWNILASERYSMHAWVSTMTLLLYSLNGGWWIST